MSPCCLAMMSRLPRYHRVEGFDETGFRRAVDKAIKNGYSTYDSIILDRTTSAIGVAICDPDGYPIAGIGATYITGWLNEAQWQNCLTLLQQTAEKISNDLHLKVNKAT